MKYGLFIFALVLFYSCSEKKNKLPEISHALPSPLVDTSEVEEIINPNGAAVISRFNPPSSFRRLAIDTLSFGNYLRNLPLLKQWTKVYLFNGQLKNRQDVHAAVVDMDVGTKDLQQCADAIMRLRAEYLFKEGKTDQIHFNFTNGFVANYDKWAQGYRIKVDGNQVSWHKIAERSHSYDSFRDYLEYVFIYAGTLSLSNEMKPVSVSEAEVGDVIIQSGSPGHAIIIVDACVNETTKERLFLLAQSYMPAQSIHILNNPSDSKISPWYKLPKSGIFRTPEWVFTSEDIKRF